MSFLRKKGSSNTLVVSTRIKVLAVVLGAGIAILFLQGYLQFQKDYGEVRAQVQYSLSGILKTLSAEIDPSIHDRLIQTHLRKDEIKWVYQDEDYYDVYNTLKKAKVANSLETEIMTLMFDDTGHHLLIGVSSSDEPKFRHRYSDSDQNTTVVQAGINPIHSNNEPLKDVISAMAPLNDTKGQTKTFIVATSDFTALSNLLWNRKLQLALNISIVAIALLIILYGIINPLLRKQELAQKLLMQKNQEWKESVSYAKRIQDSILPKEKHFYDSFSEVFILNQPKDIVSGDMLWTHKQGNIVLLALMDCTGHGVPGAFITFLAYDALNRIVIDEAITDPAAILERLDIDISKTLQKEDTHGYMHGLDIGLCAFNFGTNELTFSGARHNMLSANGELKLLKGTRRSIGEAHRNNIAPFYNTAKSFEKEDNFYFWTDGLPDQFGGPYDRKLSAKKLITILDEVSGYTLHQQKNILSTKFEYWMDKHEQIDDIFLVGLRA